MTHSALIVALLKIASKQQLISAAIVSLTALINNRVHLFLSRTSLPTTPLIFLLESPFFETIPGKKQVSRK